MASVMHRPSYQILSNFLMSALAEFVMLFSLTNGHLERLSRQLSSVLYIVANYHYSVGADKCAI